MRGTGEGSSSQTQAWAVECSALAKAVTSTNRSSSDRVFRKITACRILSFSHSSLKEKKKKNWPQLWLFLILFHLFFLLLHHYEFIFICIFLFFFLQLFSSSFCSALTCLSSTVNEAQQHLQQMQGQKENLLIVQSLFSLSVLCCFFVVAGPYSTCLLTFSFSAISRSK